MLAWKLVGAVSYCGGALWPAGSSLRFRPGDEVADSRGFSVFVDRVEAFRRARVCPGTRLVELEADGEVFVPGQRIAQIRRARVVRELPVDRTGVTAKEVFDQGWRVWHK